MSPFLPLIFLFTAVFATHFQPFYPLDLAQGYTRSLRNSSQLRSDFLHFDGLDKRDDCDPTDSTHCPDGCYRDANDVCCTNGGAVAQGDVCCDDSAGGGCAIGLICGFCGTNGVCCSDASCTVLVDPDGSSVTLGPDDCKATAGNTVASVATVGPSGTPAPTPTPTPSTTEQLSTTPSTPAVPSTTESPPPPPTTAEAPIPTTSAATVVTVVTTTTSTSFSSPTPTTPEATTSSEVVSPPPESTTSSVAQTAGVGRGVEGHGLLATTALALAVVGMMLMLA
ncbi:uncharacterized protein Z520_04165 [Fonsecaea multimorphosa CBS 102226]|uniref:Uncharacterized protein n=1 Tax=Fonsecaea multimorphosa CBS 102226 TaxID=1442371 RepID=A0A0D2KBJ1_9EURO|nr:uncharacterized protein Z520_04165 [Fonsecaea multimorphosa CBS 102226]KIY00480.1 hypothetical protein Z520_04165 [Fonsecaea multimorphosa CBS 102226]